jgi:hypothetical protein
MGLSASNNQDNVFDFKRHSDDQFLSLAVFTAMTRSFFDLLA